MRALAEPAAEAVRRTGEPVDVLVPVPLHWSRFWQRGYNQSELLARHCAAQLGVPPFVARKTLNMARGFSAAQLSEICRLCLDTEYQVKSGQLMDAGSLEKVMLTILAMREGRSVG